MLDAVTQFTRNFLGIVCSGNVKVIRRRVMMRRRMGDFTYMLTMVRVMVRRMCGIGKTRRRQLDNAGRVRVIQM